MTGCSSLISPQTARTKSAISETKTTSVWSRILAVMYGFDEALNTTELDYLERRLVRLERELLATEQ
jgi:hypothetical protein